MRMGVERYRIRVLLSTLPLKSILKDSLKGILRGSIKGCLGW
jgi:hypothetical protein